MNDGSSLPKPADDDEPNVEEMQFLVLRAMRGVNGQAFRVLGNRVHSGPFAGMVIPERAPHWEDGNAGCKLVGAYETELHDAIAYAQWRRPKVIVNVGCAEGYYAIGLKRLMGSARMYAFDTKIESLELCREYAARNEADIRIDLGCQRPGELRLADERGHRLYVVDCEGDEQTLIDPMLCPELQRADLIIECHDFLQDGVSAVLADRLAQTHRIQLIRQRVPDLSRYPIVTRHFPAVIASLMIVEKRPLNSVWLACWANRRG